MVIENEDNLTISNFTGLNVDAGPEDIGDHELLQATNVLLDRTGTFIKRPGTVADTTLYTYDCIPLGQFFVSGTEYFLVSYKTPGGTAGVYYRTAVGAWTLMGGITRQVYNVVQYNNVLYMATVGDGVWKWTGSGNATKVTGSPNVKFLLNFKSRLWGIDDGGTGNSSRLWFTDPADTGATAPQPESWVASNWLDVQPGDGDKLNCIVPYSDRIIMFKGASIWNLYPAGQKALWLVRLMNPEVGATSPNAAKFYRGLVYFISTRGIWNTDGIAVNEISKEIRPYFSPRPYPFNVTLRDWISVYGQQLIFSCDFPTASQRVFAYRFDTEIKGFSELVFPTIAQPTGVVEERLSSGASRWYIGSNKTNGGAGAGVFQLNSAISKDTVNGVDSPISVAIQTKFFNVTRPSRAKRNKYSYLLASGPNNTCTVTYISEATTLPSFSVTVKSPSSVAAHKMPGGGFFRKLSLQITESSTNPLTIDGIHLVMQLHRQVWQAVK